MEATKFYTSALECLFSLAENECHVNRMYLVNNFQEKKPEYYELYDIRFCI